MDPVEGAGLGNLEDGSKELYNSELGVTLGPEGVSDKDSYVGILDGNEELEESALGFSMGKVVLSEIGISDDLLEISEDDNIEGSELGGSLGS